jgi:E3 ubiquitin-protein ligase RNF14
MENMPEEDEREQELTALLSIYPEMVRDETDSYSATVNLEIDLTERVNLKFVSSEGTTFDQRVSSLSYLPTLKVHLKLPEGYPSEKPPFVRLATDPDWLPTETLSSLEEMVVELWESWGQVQIIFTYLDTLSDEAQRVFGLRNPNEGNAILLDGSKYLDMMVFQAHAKKDRFERQTFSCEVCLDPKKGFNCYKMSRCGHVFCKDCLRDFYTSCITEGDVHRVQCMAHKCVIKTADGREISPTISPAELLQIPLSRDLVQRYADMKRKKKIEADQSTIYCPREWCQAPARSKKYPKIGDISEMTETDDSDQAWQSSSVHASTEYEDQRLSICESCSFAFCNMCKSGWHGEYIRCAKRDDAELSVEEQASFEYIRKYTSECPTCSVPVQKQAGCNHMTCFQCRTHFCYLCSMWLDPRDPYSHYNKKGKECYLRLFDLVEGDNADGNVQFAGARRWENDAVVDVVLRAENIIQ